jgi:hypothetical protein
MEEYNEIVEYYKSTLIFKLSGIGYALNCNLLFSNRLSLLPINKCLKLIKYLKDGDKIFIDIGTVIFSTNFTEIVNNINLLNIKINFYLQDEPFVPENIINYLLPFSYKIYCTNNNYLHPNVHCMPIGIRDCGITVKPMHDNFYHAYLLNEGLKNVSKNYLCLIGGMAYINHPERLVCYNILKDKPFMFDISKFDNNLNLTSSFGNIQVNKYYEYIHQSYYVISPRGGGVDTHRFFEIIYLKSIPIVKKTNTVFDKIYNIFPCLIINEWDDITVELLKSNLPILQEKINNFYNKYPNFFTDTSILDKLLLQT